MSMKQIKIVLFVSEVIMKIIQHFRRMSVLGIFLAWIGIAVVGIGISESIEDLKGIGAILSLLGLLLLFCSR